jgi:hypothetical protein
VQGGGGGSAARAQTREAASRSSVARAIARARRARWRRMLTCPTFQKAVCQTTRRDAVRLAAAAAAAARSHAAAAVMSPLFAPCASPLAAARTGRGAPAAGRQTSSPHTPGRGTPRGRACRAAERASADVLPQLEAVPVRACGGASASLFARAARLCDCSLLTHRARGPNAHAGAPRSSSSSSSVQQRVGCERERGGGGRRAAVVVRGACCARAPRPRRSEKRARTALRHTHF